MWVFGAGSALLIFARSASFAKSKSEREQYPLTTPIGGGYTLADAVRSDTASARGIDNTVGINGEVMANIIRTVDSVIIPARDYAAANGLTFNINSFYRSPKLNAALSGAVNNSYHMRGLAVDLAITQTDSLNLANNLAAVIKEYEDILYYTQSHGRVHVELSRTKNGGKGNISRG